MEEIALVRAEESAVANEIDVGDNTKVDCRIDEVEDEVEELRIVRGGESA